MNKINSFYVTIGDSSPGISYPIMNGVKISELTLDLHVSLILSDELEQFEVRLSDINGELIPKSRLPHGTYQILGPDKIKVTTLNLSVTFKDPTPYKRSTFTIELLKDSEVIDKLETSFFIVGGEADVKYW